MMHRTSPGKLERAHHRDKEVPLDSDMLSALRPNSSSFSCKTVDPSKQRLKSLMTFVLSLVREMA